MSAESAFSDLFADAPSAVRVDGGTVEVRKLTRKFVDSAASIPDESTDVLYYTLAVGHHTGVIDCFERALSMPRASASAAPSATTPMCLSSCSPQRARWKTASSASSWVPTTTW